MYGGAKWRSGQDTCVFKPAVLCDGETAVAPNSVSRIVPRDTSDEHTERIIRDTFPDLVADESVTLHTQSCTPSFTSADLVPHSVYTPKPGCQSLEAAGLLTPGPKPQLVNLITPYRDGGAIRVLADNYMMPKGAKLVALIQPILNAAVAMVPDDGPWVIHADCHFGNILLNNRTQTASLSDWGRTLIVSAPIGPASIRTGIEEFLIRGFPLALEGVVAFVPPGGDRPLTREEWYRAAGLGRAAWNARFRSLTRDELRDAVSRLSPAQFRRAIDSMGGNFPQHPQRILDALKSFFPDVPTDLVRADVKAIRGWLPYVLLNQFLNVTYRRIPGTGKFPESLQQPTQAFLRSRITTLLEAFAADALDFIPRRQQEARAAPAVALESAPAASAPAARPEIVGGMYWPGKYFRGLSTRKNRERKRDATRRTKMSWKNPRAYTPFKTDIGVKTRRSSYTSRFHKRCPNAKTLPEISRCTKVPTKTLRTVYNRGMAAWRTGHRPGASQHAWGMARVHSFVMHGKTYRTADKDLAKKR